MLSPTPFIVTIAATGIFVGVYFGFAKDPQCSCSVWYFGQGIFSTTKSISILINVCLAFLFMHPVFSLMRTCVRIPKHIISTLHGSIGGMLLVLSVAHVVINSYLAVSFFNKELVTSTGVILFIILATLAFTSFPHFRQVHYTTFTVVHYTCLILLLIFLPTHANFCYFKWNDGSCISKAWVTCAWVLPIAILPMVASLSKFFPAIRKNKLAVCRVVHYPGGILQIFFSGQSELAPGDVIYICDKKITPLEWHPFTIATQNSIFLKIRGDWTTQLAKSLGISTNGDVIPTLYPELLYDGPYKSPGTKLCDSAFISTGIGLTSFSHCLTNNSISNCYGVLVVKNLEELEWFFSLNGEFRGLSLLVFVTCSKNATQVDHLPDCVTQVSFHRPDWPSVFKYLQSKGIQQVYYSGIKSVLKDVAFRNACKRYKLPVSHIE